jgi:serine/threonine protein phosphatase 1
MRRKRIIAVGDIHGYFHPLKKLLENIIEFNPKEDLLIFLGDYIDRGFQSKEVVLYVSRVRDKNPSSVILLKGNHELMAEDYFSGADTVTWTYGANGGKETIESFGGVENCKSVLLPFIKTLIPYALTNKHVFVHGGIPFGKALKKCTEEELVWERDNWRYTGKKLLVVGHTPNLRVTRYPNNVVAVDTGVFYYGLLSAYDVLNDRVYEVGLTWRRDLFPEGGIIQRPVVSEWDVPKPVDPDV